MPCQNIGELGEDLVAQWLQSQDWIILHRRFSSRWGEIDIIAQYDEKSGEAKQQSQHSVLNTQHGLNALLPITALTTQHSLLAFVEVKTAEHGK